MRRKVAAGFLVLVALVAVLPFVMDGEHLVIDPGLRKHLESQGHRFARLELGTIHYEIGGPEEGPLVVLLHGVSGPLEAFDPLVEPLQEAGFRTLRYDHFGRGWSDRIDARYDLSLFVTTLEQLLLSLDLDGAPLRLVGSSMGAIVATEYSLRHPERVERLALIGPAGFPIEASFLAKFIKVPLVGDYLMMTFGDRTLAEHNRKYFVAPERFDDFQRRYEQQLEIDGTKAAILSTMRHTPVQSYLDGYRKLGEVDVPVLIAWGKGDSVFPYDHHREAEEAVPRAEVFGVDEAGHLPMLEQPEAVLDRLVPFLKSP